MAARNEISIGINMVWIFVREAYFGGIKLWPISSLVLMENIKWWPGTIFSERCASSNNRYACVDKGPTPNAMLLWDARCPPKDPFSNSLAAQLLPCQCFGVWLLHTLEMAPFRSTPVSPSFVNNEIARFTGCFTIYNLFVLC
jgi:hypothetical protein